jgi:hypothetical protein
MLVGVGTLPIRLASSFSEIEERRPLGRRFFFACRSVPNLDYIKRETDRRTRFDLMIVGTR